MLPTKSELKLQGEVTFDSEHKDHSWALRVIGQDLTEILPDYLEIEFDGEAYIARGRAGFPDIEAERPAKKRSVGRKRGQQSKAEQNDSWRPSKDGLFEHRYSFHELTCLDDEWVARRKNTPIAPDIYVLGERLRTIGKMIEIKDGQLINLTIDNYRITFKYRESHGETRSEEHSIPVLYRSQQGDQTKRGTGKQRNPWETMDKYTKKLR